MYKSKINELKNQIDQLRQNKNPNMEKITYFEGELHNYELKQQEIERVKLDKLIQSVKDKYQKTNSQKIPNLAINKDEIIM